MFMFGFGSCIVQSIHNETAGQSVSMNECGKSHCISYSLCVNDYVLIKSCQSFFQSMCI